MSALFRFVPLLGLPLAEALPHIERMAERMARETPEHPELPALQDELARVRRIVAGRPASGS